MSAHRPRLGRRSSWVGTAVSVVALLLAASACGSESDAILGRARRQRRPRGRQGHGRQGRGAADGDHRHDADRQADPHGQEDHLRQLRRRGLRHPGPDPRRGRGHPRLDGRPGGDRRLAGEGAGRHRRGHPQRLRRGHPQRRRQGRLRQADRRRRSGRRAVRDVLLARRPPATDSSTTPRPTSRTAPIGDYLAAEVVSDSGGKANALYVNISAFQILAQVGETFEDGHEEVLPVVHRRLARHPADVARQGRAGPDRLLPAQPPGRELHRAVRDRRSRRRPARRRSRPPGSRDKVTIVGQGGGSQNFADMAGRRRSTRWSRPTLYSLRLPDARRAGAALGRASRSVDAGPPYWLVKKDTAPADTSKPFPTRRGLRGAVEGALGQVLTH